MEDLIFGFCLFGIFYSVLCWLVFTDTQSRVEDKDRLKMNDSDRMVVGNQSIAIIVAKPMEEQLKDCREDDVTKVIKTITEVEKKPTVEDLLDGIEIEKITLRKARKVASALGIRQKVNGKDHKKDFLVAQIKKRLELNPIEVAPIIVEKVRAA